MDNELARWAIARRPKGSRMMHTASLFQGGSFRPTRVSSAPPSFHLPSRLLIRRRAAGRSGVPVLRIRMSWQLSSHPP